MAAVAAPCCTGVCFDRPDVCARASAHLQSTDPELAERLVFVEGDFFGDLPGGADLYLLKNVLHNWTDDTSIKILRRIHAAMEENRSARLLVIEPPLDEGPPNVRQAMDDLMQIVICEPGTTARSFETMRALLERASFVVTEVHDLPTGHAVIETRSA